MDDTEYCGNNTPGPSCVISPMCYSYNSFIQWTTTLKILGEMDEMIMWRRRLNNG